MRLSRLCSPRPAPSRLTGSPLQSGLHYIGHRVDGPSRSKMYVQSLPSVITLRCLRSVGLW
ncbi:hypothetical protein E2C01_026912 [Portunus trituberculatus]|uniref:Uncharacterized protein n=1 Tax=Portunus trituberculatus TaxID=210409 RepID=A0A5B7EJY5_PORTR|nr:hypothetical protein [Portunus trituberculatus]